MTLIEEQSKKLIEIIESHQWQLIDVSDCPTEWDDINKRETATVLEVKKQYLFVPKPQEGKTYLDAYAEATYGDCVKPSFRVNNNAKGREEWVAVDIFQNPHIFSRLFIPDSRYIAASCPGIEHFVSMRAEKAVENFSKYFSITDYQKTEKVKISWDDSEFAK